MTSKKICDYRGYSCNCAGFVVATGSLCVCGHQRSQHNSTLPIIDIDKVAMCPDYDNDCNGMSVEQVMACMLHTRPPLTGICVEMQRRQTGEHCGRLV